VWARLRVAGIRTSRARVLRLMVPSLGRMKLSAVRPDDLQRLYAAKLAAQLSPKMVH
jgi:hypothetical protein